MKRKLIVAAFAAAIFVTQVATACHIFVTVSCPNNGNSAAGIMVCATSISIPSQTPTCGLTDGNGFVDLFTPGPDTYNVCVDITTLPSNASLATPCQTITCSGLGVSTTFDLTGDLCSPPPTGAKCWETGGGTLDKSKGNVVWTFGGVIYPGCSSAAAGGGNLNIVNHVTGLHFKGTDFVVDDCRGVPTKSPKVTVNIIDWHGTGYVSGADESKKTPVSFVGTFRDAKESGAGADGLYIRVVDGGGNLVFQIGGGPDDLDLLTTGNVQIHQSSCGKGKP
jgi:hypothetical protein